MHNRFVTGEDEEALISMPAILVIQSSSARSVATVAPPLLLDVLLVAEDNDAVGLVVVDTGGVGIANFGLEESNFVAAKLLAFCELVLMGANGTTVAGV